MRYISRKVVSVLDTIQACNNLESAVKEYGHRVQSLAFVYLKNRFDAEDVAQEVFLAYFRKAPEFDTPQKEKAWLMKVTVNRCKSLLRAKFREEIPLTEEIAYLPPEENELMQAVLSLDEKYRMPIHLHYYEGYSLEEIAGLFHVRTGTVGSWLTRGREKLKQMLKEDYFET